ncbi:PilZ domain-containing protein [Sphingomonas sp. TREG-RG-20F-R18-01]|uniref:PilZ domain-containing protein n=1 Tax=Sphingomonas sp. TREG-RG-20F-R18-01 TaxID=2914982 RepID=UPI001F59FE79|nr:PilZ domain-containing protein [Sphingomonas sp. TREG-RG-20F-R18-01]
MFSAEIVTLPGHAGTVRSTRKADRSDVTMPGRVGDLGARSLCRISDLSTPGARLKTFQPLVPHSVIMLRLPSQPPRRARIVWADDFTAGCAFERPIDQALLDALVAIYGFTPALPEIGMFRLP